MLHVNTALLGGTASFFGGVSAALLASYPIPAHSIFIGFVSLFFGLLACLLGAWVIVQEYTHRERVRAERVVELTVDQMLKRRGLELVDDC